MHILFMYIDKVRTCYEKSFIGHRLLNLYRRNSYWKVLFWTIWIIEEDIIYSCVTLSRFMHVCGCVWIFWEIYLNLKNKRLFARHIFTSTCHCKLWKKVLHLRFRIGIREIVILGLEWVTVKSSAILLSREKYLEIVNQMLQ